MNQIDVGTLNRLKTLDSATVFNATAEVQGKANEDYTGPEIKCLLPELGTIVGYAITAEATPLDPKPPDLSWDDFYDHLNDTPGPMITVMKDSDDRPNRAAIFGDGMAHSQKALGVVGAVIDGCVRDLAGIKSAGLPIFGTGLVPGHGPFHLRSFRETIIVGQVTINNGDLLLGDMDGVVKIPTDIVEDVLRAAGEIRARERKFFHICDAPDFDYENVKAWKENLK